MNLSNDTIAILKNFANINQNILVKPGEKLNTISTMKNILATASIKETFEQEFAIYDLPEFLRTLDLFETPTLKFNGGTSVGISGKDGKSSSKYTFADKSVIVAEIINGTLIFFFLSKSLKAINAALAFKVSKTVSIKIKSTPDFNSASIETR